MAEENPLNWVEEPAENYLDTHLLYRGVKRFLWASWPNLETIYPMSGRPISSIFIISGLHLRIKRAFSYASFIEIVIP